MKFGIERLNTLKDLIQELAQGLSHLSFEDNFDGFKQTVEITANSEAIIANPLKFIPSTYIITMQTGNGNVTASNTKWTRNNVYMFNHGPDTVTVTIQFLE